ncbi:MAG: tetratricopeptide repeat protein, partial [Elusimicrobia bacterium]|nr:tetratricopeptide repeat protein [Elusimicrobiota bacterium]
LLADALKKYPGEINLYKDLIDFYTRQNRRKEAEVLCGKAASLIDINVGNIEDYLPIGVQAFQFGLLDEAGKIFKKVSEAKPWSGYIVNNLASVYHAEKNYHEAEKHYKMAIKKQSSNPVYYYNLGNLYYDMKEKDKAIASYKKALGFEESYSDAWYNLGFVHKESGNFKEAELCFSKVRIIESRR